MSRGSRIWRLVVSASLCMVLASGCLNPDVFNSTAGGTLYPIAPGDQPFVLVEVVNDTTATVDFNITVDEGRVTPKRYVFADLTPATRDAGVLLPFPFLRVAIGDLENPFAPAITATLPDGVTVQVPSMQNALVAGVDFQEGDTIIFRLVADARSPTAILLSTGIIDGSTQGGSFSRADTFEVVKLLLLRNGLTGLNLDDTQ